MKKFIKLFALLSLFNCFTISSCKSSVSSGETVSSSSYSSTSVTYKLEIKNSDSYSVSFNQYDSFSIENTLAISRSKYRNDVFINSTLLPSNAYSFEYTVGGNTISLNEGDILSYVGEFTVSIVDNDSQFNSLPATFTMKVNAISDIKQTLTLTEGLKTEYAVAEAFDYYNISATYTRSFTTVDGKSVTQDTSLTYNDLDITIDGENAKYYSFTELKDNMTVKVTYICPDETELNASYSIKCSTDNEYDTKTMSITFINSNKTTTDGDKGYYEPSEVTTNTMKDYSNYSYSSWKYTPSTGNVNMLVVPIILPGDSVLEDTKAANLASLEKGFNGDDCSFESLKTYYQKASYNQLNFSSTFTDVLNVSSELQSYPSYNRYKNINGSSSSSDIESLVEDASSWALDWVENSSDYSISDYDSDKDGCIDGIWFIYLGHEQDSSTTLYWAFTSSTGETGTVEDPIVNIYGWCGMDFFNQDANQNVDTHTLIHETGHMLGLSDYYSYSYSGYSPLGTIDMMDHNVGDLNPYSKLVLGWIKPYIVYGSNVTLNIKSSQFKDNIIIFAYDDKEYSKDDNNLVKFNVFDEYMILDYYTPTNLNTPIYYEPYSVSTLSGAGCRLYHVDNRLGYLTTSARGGSSFKLLDDPDEFWKTSDKKLYQVISNSESGTRAESALGLSKDADYFDEIRWISADGKKLNEYTTVSTFPFGPNKKVTYPATNDSLFTVDGVSTFSISAFESQFNNSTFDNKKTCSYSFTINSIE